MFVGLHAACEDLANRVMKKSYKARLRSVGDLWLTLERRCARHMYWNRVSNSHFTPRVPENKPGLPFSVSLGRYFVPSRSIQLYEYYEDSWVRLIFTF